MDARDPRLRMMPSDIDTYARYVEGIDPARYYDSQAQELRRKALRRWPLLAAVMFPGVDTSKED